MVFALHSKQGILKLLVKCILYILVAVYPAVSFSQVDTEFWFAVPELSHRGNTGGTPGTLRIATLELEATVTISMPENTYDPVLNPGGFQDIVRNIPANSTSAVDLSHLIDIQSNPFNNRLENKALTANGKNNFGLHITSTNMITAYWEVNYDFGADLWTLKGANALGTLFYTPFQNQYNNRNLSPITYSAIDIVATEDNTQVTFTLPPGVAASYGSFLSPVPAGSSLPITLNRGQTFSLFPVNYSTLATDRLAGTKIESSKPIAVSVKDDAVAAGSQGQDVVGDQIIPVRITGNNYLVPEINNPNHVYVVGTQDNTPIYVYSADGIPIGGSPYTVIDEGEQALIVVPNGAKYANITSELNPGDPYKPFYTFQMGLENQSRGGAIIPPIGCTGNTQLAFTRARADNKFNFFIIVEKGNEDKFLLDGVRNDGIIDPAKFTDIGTSGWTALFTGDKNSNVLPVGQHLVENTGGIFHLGILNGFPGAARGRLYYGYYSDFGQLNIGANIAGTNSEVILACYGDPVQLHAFGGTNYQWTPDSYLDDATSNTPTAVNLPPGSHNYEVLVSGACGSDIVDLSILIFEPVKAFFEADVASGCSPLEINIEDGSNGNISWQYDLGDGSSLIRYDSLLSTSAINEPPSQPFTINHTYTNNTDSIVEYEITLLVKNGSGCSDILTKKIIVYPEINSDFSIVNDNSRGCHPLEVQFQNNSTGDTATWQWEFGDGGSSVAKNPQHTFTNLFGPDSMTFTTSLVAVSPNFCRDTSYHEITVMPYIEAKFAFDTVTACTPHEIVITDQSYGADSYSWDFGDGSVSTTNAAQFNKEYQNTTSDPITYALNLRVENDEGCFDTLSRNVTVFPEVISSFVASTDEDCSPFGVNFQNTSNGADEYFWDFGDGGTSTEPNPVHLYERNMMDHDTTYTVSLLATTDQICRDTSFFDILVHPYIEAAFTIEKIIDCHPFTVNIDNQSVGADQYIWDFGDGTPLSNTNSPGFQHTYNNFTSSTQVYTLKLIVKNNQGCSDTLSRNITVHPEISANFTADNFTGCHPMTVNFTDLSNNPEIWYWEFGDGTASIDQHPQHIFTNYGTSDTTYMVSLTTSSADGVCVKTTSWPILVHPLIEAEFTFPDAVSCNPFEVTLENLSKGGSVFNWDFGDGNQVSTANPDPVSNIFVNNDNNLKSFEVVLEAVSNAGCISEVRKTVGVYPDINVDFNASSNEGCHPLRIDFTNQTTGGQDYFWEFGDGSSSNLQDPSHVFTNTGTADSIYTVRLISVASNNECRDTLTMDIIVHPYVSANFDIEFNPGCNPFDVVIENSSVNGNIYHWDFGDGTDTVTNSMNPFIHRFSNPDFNNQKEYEIHLTTENFAGCTNEISRKVTVEPDIRAQFTANQLSGCHPLEVVFTNNTDGAAYYNWDFGDGTSSDTLNPVKTFINTGVNDTIYTVQLMAHAPNHECRDSFQLDILVHPFINAEFTSPENIKCSPSQIIFHNSSTGGDSFHWDFEDGRDTITKNMDPVTHSFVNPDFNDIRAFQITLTAENAAGCTDLFTKAVEVYPSIEADYITDQNEGCHPFNVEFTNSGGGGNIFYWDYDDGSTSEENSPDHVFTNFSDTIITRQVRLFATSKYQCKDEKSYPVIIHPRPKARFITENVFDCPPFNVIAENTSMNADEYEWTFGDGDFLSTSSDGSVEHIYNNSSNDIATYDLRLVSASEFGCKDSAVQKIYVYPPATADFRSNQEGCSPLTAYFTNESVNGDSYLWDFGDGSSMTIQDPANVYFNFSGSDTTLYVNLTTTTKYGCKDSKVDSIMVYAQPDAEFIASPTHQEYPASTVNLTNASSPGDWNYFWDMGDGNTNNEEFPDPYRYATWGNYEIKLEVSSEHCADSVSHTIRIFPGAPQALFDTIFPGCVPHTVQFTNRSNYGDSYLWDFDDGTTSTEFEPVHTFTEPGYYNVKLIVDGEGGRVYAYRQVEVYRLPDVDFKVAPNLVMLPDQAMQTFNLSEFGETWLWDFGDGNISTEENPDHLYTETGVYDISLEAWSEYGCTNRLVKENMVEVRAEGMIIFPNAFKPNRTGPNGGLYSLDDPEKNNIFHPYWEGVEEYHLDIYSRWGELLFTSDDINIGWDGYWEGKKASQGVYVYKAQGKFVNGEPFYIVGDVTLLH